MKFIIITLLPEVVRNYLASSMMWKAEKDGLAQFDVIDLREYGVGAHRQVDDAPYGGGDGMLLMIKPLTDALAEAKKRLPEAKVLLMSPSERVWSQSEACKHANSTHDYIIICGRYEGFDTRILTYVDEVISVGEYILTGGELPALSVIDSIVRLIPGVLGGEKSAEIESYSDGKNLEYPQYTRPEEFDGVKVPEILLSGNHGEIDKWRKINSK
jgi:tRNA (guanine-N1)-methyltransferase